jgi:hypothetical protein
MSQSTNQTSNQFLSTQYQLERGKGRERTRGGRRERNKSKSRGEIKREEKR